MVKRNDNRITRASGMTTWRAGCGGSRTSGSEGGPEKPTSRKADRALRSDPYPENHGADATLAALCEILDRIPEPLRRTLTWDQGREMARHHDLADLCGIDIFFAEPVRHEALLNPAVVKGHGRRAVAAARSKLRAA